MVPVSLRSPTTISAERSTVSGARCRSACWSRPATLYESAGAERMEPEVHGVVAPPPRALGSLGSAACFSQHSPYLSPHRPLSAQKTQTLHDIRSDGDVAERACWVQASQQAAALSRRWVEPQRTTPPSSSVCARARHCAGASTAGSTANAGVSGTGGCTETISSCSRSVGSGATEVVCAEEVKTAAVLCSGSSVEAAMTPPSPITRGPPERSTFMLRSRLCPDGSAVAVKRIHASTRAVTPARRTS